MLYNAVSLMKSVIASVHGEEAVDNMSWYYAYMETQAIWSGMDIALPFEFWSERFDAMPDEEFCGYLKELGQSGEETQKNKDESAVIIVPDATRIAGIVRFFENFDECGKG